MTDELSKPLMSDNGFPRSIRVDLFTPAETAIHTALIAVEAVGADPLLTDAVILLGDAQKKVAEWVDREIVAGRMAMPVGTQRNTPVSSVTYGCWIHDTKTEGCWMCDNNAAPAVETVPMPEVDDDCTTSESYPCGVCLNCRAETSPPTPRKSIS